MRYVMRYALIDIDLDSETLIKANTLAVLACIS